MYDFQSILPNGDTTVVILEKLVLDLIWEQ